MLSALILFALGSTICGAASSMNMLIAGRSASIRSRLLATTTTTAGGASTCVYAWF